MSKIMWHFNLHCELNNPITNMNRKQRSKARKEYDQARQYVIQVENEHDIDALRESFNTYRRFSRMKIQ